MEMKRLVAAMMISLTLAVSVMPAQAFEFGKLVNKLDDEIFGLITIGGIAGGITLIHGQNAAAAAAGAGCGTWLGKELMDWRMGRETSFSEMTANCVGGAYWGYGINQIGGPYEVLWAAGAGGVSGWYDELWETWQMEGAATTKGEKK